MQNNMQKPQAECKSPLTVLKYNSFKHFQITMKDLKATTSDHDLQ